MIRAFFKATNLSSTYNYWQENIEVFGTELKLRCNNLYMYSSWITYSHNNIFSLVITKPSYLQLSDAKGASTLTSSNHFCLLDCIKPWFLSAAAVSLYPFVASRYSFWRLPIILKMLIWSAKDWQDLGVFLSGKDIFKSVCEQKRKQNLNLITWLSQNLCFALHWRMRTRQPLCALSV